jgi:hypothetical protein
MDSRVVSFSGAQRAELCRLTCVRLRRTRALPWGPGESIVCQKFAFCTDAVERQNSFAKSRTQSWMSSSHLIAFSKDDGVYLLCVRATG